MEKIEWSLRELPIKDLRPFSKNPRRMTKHQARHLSCSLEKFGLIDKPIVNHDMTIIGGHQRINILKKSQKTVQCWYPNRQLDEKEVDELNIRLNKNGGEWDDDILANVFQMDDLISWGFDDLLNQEDEKEKPPYIKITIKTLLETEAESVERILEEHFPDLDVSVKKA